MPRRRTAPARHLGADETQSDCHRRLRDNRGGQRTTDCEHCGNHHCFFLSLRTRSISFLSASSSWSVHDASPTRAVTICPSEPPKNVCRYCCSAVRLATAGE